MTDEQLDEYEALAATEEKVEEIMSAHRRVVGDLKAKIQKLEKRNAELRARLAVYRPDTKR